MVPAIIWVLIGALMEPLWVIGLKRLETEKSLTNYTFTGIFMLLSPIFLSFGMHDMGMGVAYSIWTGLGAVITLIAGYFLYHDNLDAKKITYAGMIIIGVIGLEMVSGGSA